MNKKIVGFLGYGSIAKKHIDIILNNYNDYKIIIYRKKNHNLIAKKHSNKLIVKNINSVEELMHDYLFITNPSSLHYESLSKYKKSALNIFVEKPIFNKYHEIKSIIQYFAKNNIKFQVGYVFRYDKVLNNFRKIIKKIKFTGDEFINIICKSDLSKWRKKNNYDNRTSLKKKLGGGVLLELSHEIDYCVYLFGLPQNVFAYFENTKKIKNCDVEDSANIILIYKNGMKVNIQLSFSSDIEERYCQILQENNIFRMDLLNRRILVKTNKKQKINQINTSLSDSYLNQIRDFLNNKRNKKYFLGISDSINVIRIIESIRISNKSKQIVKICN